jgi:hypothetical protein
MTALHSLQLVGLYWGFWPWFSIALQRQHQPKASDACRHNTGDDMDESIMDIMHARHLEQIERDKRFSPQKSEYYIIEICEVG